jgi:hypothetical protein
MTLHEGLSAGNRRLGAIAWWTFIAGTAGLLIRAIRALPFLGELAETLISAALGLVWGAATFFVIPILAIEQRDAKGSVERSAQQVFRVVLYRFASGQPVPGAFDRADLEQAIFKRRGLFRRRW